jgi:acyl-CoA dehydrogenase
VDFALSPELAGLRARVRAFVEDEVIPVEDQVLDEVAAGDWRTLEGLRVKTRDLGLWTPHLPVEHGGLGLGVFGMGVLFRAMGRSLVGPSAFNCDAPDQGNMDLLLSAGSQAQRDRWLGPLVRGEIRSAFAMTEPAPGAGADPSNLRTRAVADGDGWVINGHKWYTTGGLGAAFLIVMARTSDDVREGASMFLVPSDAPGLRYVRDIPVMAPDVLHHVEGEFAYEDVRVGPESLIGGVGQGFALAQKRLVPARLTHCMRWLGLCDRALDLCRDYLGRRISFGKPLSGHQLVQQMVARNATGIHAGNLMTLHAAWLMDASGSKAARSYSSMTKNHVAKLLCQVLDDAIQLHGALGYSEDLPFARWYRTARAARIADGPDEVHTMVVARDYLRGRFNPLI